MTDKKSKILSDTTQTSIASAEHILKRALREAPKTAYFLYNFPATKSGTINLSAYQSNNRLYQRLQYRFDQYSGKLLQSSNPMVGPEISTKLVALNYDLHTGSALGLFGKALAFLVSLIAAGLPITGFIIWIKKGKKGKRKDGFKNNTPISSKDAID